MFTWQSLVILNVFKSLTLKKSLKKKLEYRFLVESTVIENATFPYKTVLSKTNIKTSIIKNIKWSYKKKKKKKITNKDYILKIYFDLNDLS